MPDVPKLLLPLVVAPAVPLNPGEVPGLALGEAEAVALGLAEGPAELLLVPPELPAVPPDVPPVVPPLAPTVPPPDMLVPPEVPALPAPAVCANAMAELKATTLANIAFFSVVFMRYQFREASRNVASGSRPIGR